MIDDIERIAEMAQDMLDEASKAIDRLLPATGPATHRPSKMELAEFVAQVQQQSPPQWFIRPDGTEVFASPYLLALAETENGKALMKRIQSLYEVA